MMKIYEYLRSDQNIFHAIYSLKNSIQERNLLDTDDKDELIELYDIFNTDRVIKKINEVKARLTEIVEKDVYFRAKVYFIPKSWDKKNKKIKYRPMHTANLTDQICMIAMLNCLIGEIADSDATLEVQNGWKIGGIAKLIPSNFYGNVLSDKTEGVYKKWQPQYSEYTKNTNDFERQYKKTGEYKYEICLDIRDFFPSINPQYIICYYMNRLTVDMSDDDKDMILILLRKLLYIELDTENMNDSFLEIYYGCNDLKKESVRYVKGIAQGLVQGYFFANLFMAEVSRVYMKIFPGKQLFYVDDSVIFSNVNVEGNLFSKLISDAEKEINELVKTELEHGRVYNSEPHFENSIEYLIKIHNPEEEEECKSVYIDLQRASAGQIFLGNLSRMASGVAIELNNDFNADEMEMLENRLEMLVNEIEIELNNVENQIKALSEVRNEEECLIFLNYKKQLIRYKKYFNYRFYIINFRKEFSLKKIYDYIKESMNTIRKMNDNNQQEDFLEFYTRTILNAIISFFIKNVTDNYDEEVKKKEEGELDIRNLINELNNYLYLDLAGEYAEKLSFVYKSFQDYIDLKPEEKDSKQTVNENLKRIKIKNLTSYEDKKYYSLTNCVALKLPNMMLIAEDHQYNYVKKYLQEALNHQGKVYEVLEQPLKMKSVYKIVESGSNEIKRMLLNASISYLCNIQVSDNFNFIKMNNRPIRYCEIRILAFLRNYYFDEKILQKRIDEIFTNEEKIDYSILEVIQYFNKFVKNQEFIDALICVHKYTCDLWKNGSKYLYFYTMHNQEHAIDLIRSSIELVRAINYIKLKKIDYFILFVACYLHDIAMVNIPNLKRFQEDIKETNLIATRFSHEFETSRIKDRQYVKEMLVDYYVAMDTFFENMVRSQHAKQSAKDIRTSKELDFLEICLKEVVAEVSEAHGQGWADVYRKKSVAQEMTYSLKYMQIILRLADALDMKKYRVSKLLLNKNIENMSKTSAFHWISHTIINDMKINVSYETDLDEQEEVSGVGDKTFRSRLIPGRIKEKIQLEVHYGSMSKNADHKRIACQGVKMDIENGSIVISVENFKEKSKPIECKQDKCNIACKWFAVKNNYLIEELVELQRYLKDVEGNFFSNEFSIKLVNDRNASLTQKQIDIIRSYLDEY